MVPRSFNLQALHKRWTWTVGAATVILFVASLVALVTLPTGASSADAVVPKGARVAAREPVGSARVLLLSQGKQLRLLVAYERDEGWHGAEVAAPPADAAAAWAATRGGAGVPALSAVYGRTDTGARVKVTWADGQIGESLVRPDRTFLVVRPGHARSGSVAILGADGAVISTIEGP